MSFLPIERKQDVITGAVDLEVLHSFRDFPVFMGCSQADQAGDLVADMQFCISRGSGMIQLNPLLPLEILYPEAHGSGLVGKSWEIHHQALADFIAKFDPQSVLEIGGAHGILASKYQATRPIPWTILEPNPTPVAECRASFIKGFFDADFSFDGGADAIVHSHVFEHIYDPELFVKHQSDFLAAGKKLIFSVPNMRVMLERKYTNCLNFEHTTYLSESYIDYLLAKHGFRILEKTPFLDDHSIFYCAVRDPQAPPLALPSGLYEANKALYLDYVRFHQELITEINAKLAAAGDRRAFLFGAHVQAQYLIGFGMDLSKVEAILDNDANKHGKRLVGTNKTVRSPAALAHVDRPLVVIRAGTFTNEIMAQIKSINPSTEFIS